MAKDRLQQSVQGIKDKGQRQAAYYRLQREDAAETGNQKTTDSINKKLGKKSQDVSKNNWNDDWNRNGKGRLGALASVALPEVGLLGKAASAGSKLARGAKGAETGIARAFQDLGRATPVKKALGSAKAALSSKKGQTALSAAKDVKRGANAKGLADSMKNVTPKKALSTSKTAQKALPAENTREFDSELQRLQKKGKNMPKNPKTFNRDGSLRAEGRKKSQRNPTSNRQKKSG